MHELAKVKCTQNVLGFICSLLSHVTPLLADRIAMEVKQINLGTCHIFLQTRLCIKYFPPELKTWIKVLFFFFYFSYLNHANTYNTFIIRALLLTHFWFRLSPL